MRKNKHRNKSIRLEGYDYSSNGLYFITICTKNREHFFGEIINKKMKLSEMGKLVHKYWNEITKNFSFVILHSFVVMPDHIHGIIEINKNCLVEPMDIKPVGTRLIACLQHPQYLQQSTQTQPHSQKSNHHNPQQTHQKRGGITQYKNPMLHKNISTMIRWFKGRTSYEINKKHSNFAWQSRFHDHIIYNHQEFEIISKYIIDNPKNWK